MSQLWEWVGDTTISKQVNRRYTAPPSSSSYGNVYDQDLQPWEIRRNFRLRGMKLSEIQTLVSAMFGTSASPVRGQTYTIVDKRNITTVGTVLNFGYALIDGSGLNPSDDSAYYTATLQMRI